MSGLFRQGNHFVVVFVTEKHTEIGDNGDIHRYSKKESDYGWDIEGVLTHISAAGSFYFRCVSKCYHNY